MYPFEREWTHFTSMTYIDEFSELHGKDVPVREALAGQVPSAGVGTCFSRRAVTARAVFENPQHPYTRKLLAAVPVAEPSRQRPQRVLLSDDLPSNIHLRGEEVAAVSLQCVGPGH